MKDKIKKIMAHLGLSAIDCYSWLNGSGKIYKDSANFLAWIERNVSFDLPEEWEEEIEKANAKIDNTEEDLFCPYKPEAQKLDQSARIKWCGAFNPPEEPDWIAIARSDSRLKSLAAERGRVVDAADIQEVTISKGAYNDVE